MLTPPMTRAEARRAHALGLTVAATSFSALRLLKGLGVRAHLARESRRSEDASARVWFAGRLAIDYAQRTVEVFTEGGQDAPTSIRLDLTRTEFDIVALLSKKPGRVYDRAFIYEQVWGWNAAGDPAIVREHIRRIRKKFLEASGGLDPIETVWGVGYRWSAR